MKFELNHTEKVFLRFTAFIISTAGLAGIIIIFANTIAVIVSAVLWVIMIDSFSWLKEQDEGK